MHAEARDFVARTMGERPWGRVVEFGSRYINGRVRDLIDAAEYHGIDQVAGQDVDEVANVRRWRTRRKADAVVCCEVLEHAAVADQIVASAALALKKGGLLVITCATDPREPHSGADGGPVRDGEYYANVDPRDLGRWLEESGLVTEAVEIYLGRGDLYVAARRP